MGSMGRRTVSFSAHCWLPRATLTLTASTCCAMVPRARPVCLGRPCGVVCKSGQATTSTAKSGGIPMGDPKELRHAKHQAAKLIKNPPNETKRRKKRGEQREEKKRSRAALGLKTSHKGPALGHMPQRPLARNEPRD